MRPRDVNNAIRTMMAQIASGILAWPTTTIELGHATDTTLSRGAAGFMAVEGKRVPAPASQAAGDILYRGSTEWERLAKGTAFQVLRQNTALTAPEWATAREVLTANRTYYVRTDGSDSNNGLADTSGGAFLTIAKAATVAATLDGATFNVTISAGSGTFSENVVLPAMLGSGTYTLTGAGTGSTTIQAVRLATRSEWTITSFKVSGGTNLLELGAYSKCNQSGAIEFGTGTEHVYGRANSYWLCTANYTVSGAAARHWRFDEGGTVFAFGRTVTITGTPAFSGNFAYILYGTSAIVGSMTFSGSATGSRFYVGNNSIIATGGGGASYLPGNSAGTTDTASGGIYT